MLSKSGIYQIRNTVNGKVYVGSTKLLRKRWEQHRNELKSNRHGNRYLQAAWKKYGESAFVFEPLITCAPSMLLWYEQQFIDQLMPEYNLRPMAANNAGFKFSDAQKAHLRKIKSGEAWRASMSASKTGSTRPDETKLKISRGMKAISACPEWRERVRQRQIGTKRTAETRDLQSRSKRRFYESEENRAAASVIARERECLTRLELNGVTKTITEWAEHTGISMWAIRQRIEAGWSIEKALTKPNQKALIEYKGETKLLADWAREYNLKPTTLAQRLKKWDMEKALTAPLRDWSTR